MKIVLTLLGTGGKINFVAEEHGSNKKIKKVVDKDRQDVII